MILLYSSWLRLPINTRHAIARDFNIPKKGATEVVSNEIVRDGFNVNDLENALTIEAIQKYVGTQLTDIHVLWENMVLKAEGKSSKLTETPAASTHEPPVPTQIAQEPLVNTAIPKRRGRPPRNRA